MGTEMEIEGHLVVLCWVAAAAGGGGGGGCLARDPPVAPPAAYFPFPPILIFPLNPAVMTK